MAALETSHSSSRAPLSTSIIMGGRVDAEAAKAENLESVRWRQSCFPSSICLSSIRFLFLHLGAGSRWLETRFQKLTSLHQEKLLLICWYRVFNLLTQGVPPGGPVDWSRWFCNYESWLSARSAPRIYVYIDIHMLMCRKLVVDIGGIS